MTRVRVAVLLVLAVFLAVPLMPGVAAPFTCTPTACTFEVRYTEPTTVQTGAPLSNLTSCTVSYTIAVNAGQPGPAKTVVVPASSPNGGSAIVRAVPDTALTPGNNYVIVGQVACTNPAGTGPQTAPSTPLTITRAGEVPPGVPSGVTVQ